MTQIFKVRWLTVVAVTFSAIGAALMFLIGSVTTIKAIGEYFGSEEFKAFSSDAALASTVELISALDQFLLGLVLLVFAYGVYALFVVADRDQWDSERHGIRAPDWLHVTSVTDLKVKLLEVISVLLAVLFLKGALSVEGKFEWTELVVPIAVVLIGITIWLIRDAHQRH